jgi:hypothetical protein
MLLIGISNKIDNDFSLFFYEYDNITLNSVLEESKFLSDCFNIDIYIFESSKNNYHIVSFDILKNERVLEIQRWTSLKSDYIHLDEQNLFGNPYKNNCLRVSKKENKDIPKFIRAIHNQKNFNVKSISHIDFYQKLCNIPEKYINREFAYGINTKIYFFTYHNKRRFLFNREISKIKKWQKKDRGDNL